MFQYTGEDDVTRAIKADFFKSKLIQEMLALMFKGKIANFPTEPIYTGFSTTILPAEVSINYSL